MLIDKKINTSGYYKLAVWDEVKNDIKRVNSELYEIISKAYSMKAGSKNKQPNFIKVRYPFGFPVIENGKVYFPDENRNKISVLDQNLPADVRNKLGYSSIPLGLVINKGCEVFLPFFNNIMSLNIIYPGDFFGLFEVSATLSNLTSDPKWYISAGARSTFMLPKITESEKHNKLRKKFALGNILPNELTDHWQIFTKIANSTDYQNQWFLDVIYFTDTWFDKNTTNTAIKDFHNYVLSSFAKRAWYLLNETEMFLTWQNFAASLGKRNLAPRLHLVNNIKHLITVASGGAPAFCMSDHSETLVPTKCIQHEYMETYGLKKYIPTIISPCKISSQPNNNITSPNQDGQYQYAYYSLSTPMLAEAKPSFKLAIPIIDDLKAMKFLVDTFYDTRYKSDLDTDALNKVNFEYFHNEGDLSDNIIKSSNVIDNDPLINQEQSAFKNRTFCTTGPFLKGGIRINVKITN